MTARAAEPSFTPVLALIVRRDDDDGGNQQDEAGHDAFDRLGHEDLPMTHLRQSILGDLRTGG
jgi:hypothetical protein